MRVRLIRKLADRLDGIDVSAYREGDAIELSRHDAAVLVAEGWALDHERRRSSIRLGPAVVADRPTRRSTERGSRRVRQQVDTFRTNQRQNRRAEDHHAMDDDDQPHVVAADLWTKNND